MDTSTKIEELLIKAQNLADLMAEYCAPEDCKEKLHYFCECYDKGPAEMISIIINAAFSECKANNYDLLLKIKKLSENDQTGTN